jgi:hypothetical protein
MVVRTYFEKDNVIMNLSNINTGRNPITELFYGGSGGEKGFSRYLFSFDPSKLRNYYQNNLIADLTKVKHVLRMTNTGSFDKNLLNGVYDLTKERTSSFDLIVFPISETFDEGVGYDYDENNISYGDRNIDNGASNWFNRTTLSQWLVDGVYSSGTQTILGSQHFDQGNENLEIDITDHVNAIISGNTAPSMGVAFSTPYEFLDLSNLQYVGFFSKDTSTYFEPHIETIYDNPIKDDRFSFYLDKVNCLVLYANVGGELRNLDEVPLVNIYNAQDDLVMTLTATTMSTGIYSVCFEIPSNSGYTDCTLFRDEWTNISYNGVARPNVNNEFQIIDSMSFFNIGNEFNGNKNYRVSINGIKVDEHINRGDIRKLEIIVREEFNPNRNNLIDGVYYRLYIKEGTSEYTIIDYQEVNRTSNELFFLIDTDSLIPNTYYLDVKLIRGNEVSILKNQLNFDIVNISDLRQR